MSHQNTRINLYIVRHGQSVANLEKKLLFGQGHNVPLTKLGEKQAKKLGIEFNRRRIYFDKVYSSKSERAYNTAKISLNEISYPINSIIKTDELVEYSVGEWEGKTREEVYTPETRFRMNTMGPFFAPPKGESLMMVQRRILPWLFDEIIYNEENWGKKLNIGVFTHAMTIRTLLHYAMGFNDRLIHRIGIDNASLTKLRFTEDGWYVDYVNR